MENERRIGIGIVTIGDVVGHRSKELEREALSNKPISVG